MPRVLILMTTETYRAAAFADAARCLGLDIAIGCDAELPVLRRHDDSEGGGSGSGGSGSSRVASIVLPFRDPEKAASLVADFDRKLPVDAVVALDDAVLNAAAAIAGLLRLPGNDLAAVRRTTDKVLMREALAVGEVTQPAFAVIPAHPGGSPPTVDALAVEAATGTIGFPCVVKATRLSGSQGVVKAGNLEEALHAAAVAIAEQRKRGLADANLLVERYVDGPEVVVEGVLSRGVLRVACILDKPVPLTGPFFEETVFVSPTRLPPDLARECIRTAGRAAEALGLREGPVHAELRIEAGRPFLIEVAARTIGGHCSRALSLPEGRSLEEVVLTAACGVDPAGAGTEIQRARSGTEARRAGAAGQPACGVMMIPIPTAGRLSSVTGIEAARAVAGITGVEITAAPGSEIAPPPYGDRYLGFIFARGASPHDVEASLALAHSRLRVAIDSDI